MNVNNHDEKINNIHHDHLASCLCCKNFYGSFGTPDLSDVTPGTSPSVFCDKGEYYYYGDDENTSFYEVMKQIHNTARHCKLFVPKEK